MNNWSAEVITVTLTNGQALLLCVVPCVMAVWAYIAGRLGL